MRVWLSSFPRMGTTTQVAVAAEDAGFDGLVLTDSQCLLPDPFIELSAAAEATTGLHLGTCATNLVTRHPSVLASLAASLQQRSGGRMQLGVARGDSAVTKVGLHPLAPEDFADALTSLRSLVRGEATLLDDVTVSLGWVDPATPPPVVGVASGPRTIEAVAASADGLILQVGSNPDAVARGVRQARAAQHTSDFKIAAYVIIGLATEGLERPPIDGVTGLLARMAATTLAGDGTPQSSAAAAAAQTYTVATHGQSASGQEARATEGYALIGTAAQCTEQLRAIAATGCDELIVILDSMTTDPAVLIELVRVFGDTALPALHALG